MRILRLKLVSQQLLPTTTEPDLGNERNKPTISCCFLNLGAIVTARNLLLLHLLPPCCCCCHCFLPAPPSSRPKLDGYARLPALPPPPLSRLADDQPSHVARLKAILSFLFYLLRCACQCAALQARFRSRTSCSPSSVLAIPFESITRANGTILLPNFTPDIIVRL
jgi:hypothetical protein